MSSTRRQTPVAPVPERPQSRAEKPRAHALKAPILVVTPVGEHDHEQGSLVLGRGEEANVVLGDPLVSRVHARLTIMPDDSVVLEDLHSTNGVYVNGVRVSRPTSPLAEGDRLLIGTTEISVFSTRSSATMKVAPRVLSQVVERRPPSSGKLRLSSSSLPAQQLPVQQLPVQQLPVQQLPVQQPPASRPAGAIPATERSDAAELVGRLAEHLMTSGNSAEAVRILSEHLNTVLLGASAGLAVPAPVLEHATRHALTLYSWTERASWIDYALELHAACRQTPSDTSLSMLEIAYRTAAGMDTQLVDYLVQAVRLRPEGLGRDDEMRLARLARLTRLT
jgi:pSer/pThr/pTyr-binding forkhead associated (FHA) protein